MAGAVAGDGLRRLPVRLQPVPDEALDSYLERHAAANHLDAPMLLRRVTGDLAYLPIAPTTETLDRVATLTGQHPGALRHHALVAHAGVAPIDHAAADAAGVSGSGWRHAGRAWAPGRGTQLCPACLATDGAWRVTWRHPWITVCLVHRAWLHAVCPTCERPFRMQRSSPLRTVDAADGTCGNPGGARGRTCPQDLLALTSKPAPGKVLASQRRIDAAIHHQPIPVLGSPMAGETYLDEIRALTVLLLHLACQENADQLTPWAGAASRDRGRSVAGRGPRWGLAPPVDPVLRGHALAAAGIVLAAANLDEAAGRLGPWLDLTPAVPEGQLGWLADRTKMTPLLTRLVMAATSARRRLSTLLAHSASIEMRWIPQLIPSHLYAGRLASLLDVADVTGRTFASICVARLGRPGMTWAEAGTSLGLEEESGPKTARACTADILCGVPAFVEAINTVARDIDQATDYRQREIAVRRLASRSRGYHSWSRTHTPGSHATSKTYAITWLWTTFAGGALSTGPGWSVPPRAPQRAYHRRYAARLDTRAQTALLSLAASTMEAQ